MSSLVRLPGSLGGGLLFFLVLLLPAPEPVLPSVLPPAPITPHGGPTLSSALSIVNFGAVPDGKTDAKKAVLAAWGEACGAGANGGAAPTVLVPRGTFLVGPVRLQGPCKGPVVVRVEGVVMAPADPGIFSDGYWFSFEAVNGLTVTGGGTFDGQGNSAWHGSGGCPNSPHCKNLPRSIRLWKVNGGTVESISSVNSKFFHIEVLDSNQITLQFLNIAAPADSPNTDGVHVSQSSGVSVVHSVIGTGDDCISVGPGATNVIIYNITCGPGHGISIGSLGNYPHEQDVWGVHVSNCRVSNTQNGVRIKTRPSSYASSAYNITFEDVVMSNVYNPIIIDQEYCPLGSCDPKSDPSQVSIRNVTFGNIRGTSATATAVSLRCSSAVPCRHVVLHDIDLESVDGSHRTSNCSNVQATFTEVTSPSPCAGS